MTQVHFTYEQNLNDLAALFPNEPDMQEAVRTLTPRDAWIHACDLRERNWPEWQLRAMVSETLFGDT
jgi:hypothetical protein